MVKLLKDFFLGRWITAALALQTFIGTKKSFAIWAIVIDILKGVHTEGNEAAAGYTSQ